MIPHSPLADSGGLTTTAVLRFPMGTHKLVAASSVGERALDLVRNPEAEGSDPSEQPALWRVLRVECV